MRIRGGRLQSLRCRSSTASRCQILQLRNGQYFDCVRPRARPRACTTAGCASCFLWIHPLLSVIRLRFCAMVKRLPEPNQSARAMGAQRSTALGFEACSDLFELQTRPSPHVGNGF
ncbi:hypothetical protein K466DRAFT_225157 [Polyporus arcularius HHB13444]|uniref:Uncharacterized protein n=1 Tax=Polyporus arcularius HHB13444 TaxID=1314778 RepID=A0A5C3P7B4_9APHY|nr:hypothetical protein K466DRAFT_225157 [Polyporus arcularius HHB13444]